MTKKHNKILIFGIILIGIIYRFWFFWIPSFGGDESEHVTKAVRVARGLLDLISLKNIEIALANIYLPILQHNHPPLEFLILVPSVFIEPREFSARLIYILIGLVTMLLSFKILKNLKGSKVAILFLAFFATSYYVVSYTQIVTFGLNLTAGVFIALAVLFFTKSPQAKSLFWLVLTMVFGLWVSIDYFIFVAPILVIIWLNRKKLRKKDLFIQSIAFVILVLIFYLSYFLYSQISSSPRSAGFNYYLHTYINTLNINQTTNFNFKETLSFMWNYFFGLPSILLIWPFALLGLTQIKKHRYLGYLTLILTTVALLEFPLIKCCTNYLNIFGILLILAVEGILSIKTIGTAIGVLLVVTNIVISSIYMLNNYNPVTKNGLYNKDNIRNIAQTAKNCLTDNKTYISTDDAWRTRYYFGRSMLPALEAEEITDEEAVNDMLKGKLAYEIAFVHIERNTIPKSLENEISKKAIRNIALDKDKLYLFESCTDSTHVLKVN